MSQTVPSREEVFNRIQQAQTREEIIQARRIRNAYLKAHPDDEQVLEFSEMLEMMASIEGLPVPDPELAD